MYVCKVYIQEEFPEIIILYIIHFWYKTVKTVLFLSYINYIPWRPI